ncbi:uncharacterized protein LOC142823743 [Pelodiscus sinensis]|uniref:uncharacterized protein LOC142823743 n=1 Tax=Pelodiscus sinensis TaxID=13735 RepID=UPI003F6D3AEC
MSSWHLATRIVFCKDGEEVSVQTGSKEKATYDYEHVVSGGSSGNFSCGYEIKDSDNQVTRSQLSHTQRLSVTGDSSSSDSDGDSFPPGLLMETSGVTYHRTQPGPASGNWPVAAWRGHSQRGSFLGLDLKLLLGIAVPAVLVLAVALCLLRKKGNVAPSLITLSRCFQLGLCEGIKGNESSVTPAALLKTSMNMPQWFGREEPRLAQHKSNISMFESKASTALERTDTDVHGHTLQRDKMSLMLHLLKCRAHRCAVTSDNLPKAQAALRPECGEPFLVLQLDNTQHPEALLERWNVLRASAACLPFRKKCFL